MGENEQVQDKQNANSQSAANISVAEVGTASFTPPPYSIASTGVTQLHPDDTVRGLFRGEDQVETDSGLGPVNNPVFDESRMRDEMAEAEFAGADSAELNSAMAALQGNRTEEGLTFPSVEEAMPHLQVIAELRGMDIEEATRQYQRMQEIKIAGEARGAANGHEGVSPLLDLEEHADFMGSTSQLRFGMALGDVFDIDPVFGALVSPSGGAVGPGNDSISTWDKNNPIVMHGSVHDAAGYLLNAHGIGPGYNYLQRGWELDRTNPLSGQVSGVNYFTGGVSGLASDAWDGVKGWAGDKWNGVKNWASDKWEGAKGLASDAWDGAKGWASDKWNGVKNWASDKWEGAKGLASDAWDGASGWASDQWNGVKGAAGDAWDGAKGWASDTWNGAKESVSSGMDWAADTASSAWEGTKGAASSAWDATTDAASSAADWAGDTASSAWEGTKSAASSAWDAGSSAASSAWESTSSAASSAWDGLTGLFD